MMEGQIYMQGRRNVFQSGGGGHSRAEYLGGGGRAIIARERSDRGAGASINFSDIVCAKFAYNTLRA